MTENGKDEVPLFIDWIILMQPGEKSKYLPRLTADLNITLSQL